MNFKTILFGLTMFGAGAAAGYFTCKKILIKQQKEDIEDIKEFYYNKLKELGVQESGFEVEHYDEDWDDGGDVDDEDLNDEEDIDTEWPKWKDPRGTPIAYNKIPLEELIKQVELEDDEDEEIDDDEDDFDLRIENARLKGEPYVISYDDFMDGPETYEREILYYYSKDRVLCEDDDSIVDDEPVVGLDYEDVLDMQTTVWVRNDTLNKLYEIYRIDESYSENVEGIVETPREREFRIIGRRKRTIE